MFINHCEHFRRGEVFKARPTQIIVVSPVVFGAILAFGEDAPRHRLAKAGGFVFFQCVQVV